MSKREPRAYEVPPGGAGAAALEDYVVETSGGTVWEGTGPTLRLSAARLVLSVILAYRLWRDAYSR